MYSGVVRFLSPPDPKWAPSPEPGADNPILGELAPASDRLLLNRETLTPPMNNLLRDKGFVLPERIQSQQPQRVIAPRLGLKLLSPVFVSAQTARELTTVLEYQRRPCLRHVVFDGTPQGAVPKTPMSVGSSKPRKTGLRNRRFTCSEYSTFRNSANHARVGGNPESLEQWLDTASERRGWRST